MSLTFGITGSIACGKSTVTKYIREMGIPIVDADVIAREVVIPGSHGWLLVATYFGLEFINRDDNDTLDRAKIGKRVFSNKKDLDFLNQTLGPLIKEESKRQIKCQHDLGHELVGYDAALIIENGNAKKYKPLIVVSAPFETQLARLMSRNDLTEEEAKNRISKQLSSEEKVKHADFVIETTGTLEELKTKTHSVIESIKKELNEKGLLK